MNHLSFFHKNQNWQISDYNVVISIYSWWKLKKIDFSPNLIFHYFGTTWMHHYFLNDNWVVSFLINSDTVEVNKNRDLMIWNIDRYLFNFQLQWIFSAEISVIDFYSLSKLYSFYVFMAKIKFAVKSEISEFFLKIINSHIRQLLSKEFVEFKLNCY